MTLLPPVLPVEQANGQSDPTGASPILFTATFSEQVSGFAEDDISFDGSTAPGSLTAVLSEIAPNDGTTYQISISGMSGNGTIVVSIPANRVVDESSNLNLASTSSDNSVIFDTSHPRSNHSRNSGRLYRLRVRLVLG